MGCGFLYRCTLKRSSIWSMSTRLAMSSIWETSITLARHTAQVTNRHTVNRSVDISSRIKRLTPASHHIVAVAGAANPTVEITAMPTLEKMCIRDRASISQLCTVYVFILLLSLPQKKGREDTHTHTHTQFALILASFMFIFLHLHAF